MLICIPRFGAAALTAHVVGLILFMIGTFAPAHAAQLTLTWSDASSNETGFHVERKTGTGGSYATLISVGAGATGHVDGTVTAGTTYCYRVQAYNSAGNSPYSNEACAAAATATTYSVSVTKSGTGSGTVASSPSGISCGSDCTQSYPGGTSVALSATPATGSTFTGWSGACTGTGSCALVVNGTKSVTATFVSGTAASYTLTVTKSGTGAGTITSSPTGISCGSDCTQSYTSGTSVTLSAAASSGSTFTGWSGACTGTGTCTVSMSAARSVTATFTATTASPPSGLVAAYRFNEGSGTTVANASGLGLTGTVSGATWTTAGKYGRALTFDGTNDWVTVNDASALDLTTRLTMAAWVYPTGSPTKWRTILMKEASGKAYTYSLYTTPANRPSVYFFMGGVERGVEGPNALPLNAWSHVAATYDGTTLRLYVNGAQVASRALTGALAASTGALRIGGNSSWSTTEYFTGRLDEVRIYNRALTASEVQTVMTTP